MKIKEENLGENQQNNNKNSMDVEFSVQFSNSPVFFSNIDLTDIVSLMIRIVFFKIQI